MLRLRCACGASSLDISKSAEGKVHFDVPCVYCKTKHGFVLGTELITRDEKVNLPCPFSGMDIAHLAQEDQLQEELNRSAEELSRIMASLEAEDLKDIQPQDLDEDDTPPDPSIFDSFNFLLRELEADNKISCPCKKGSYDLRFTDEGIQFYCSDCGASAEFKAKTAAMAEQYLSIDEIILK